MTKIRNLQAQSIRGPNDECMQLKDEVDSDVSAKELEARVRSLLEGSEHAGLADAARALLGRSPKGSKIACKVIEVLAQSGRMDEAEPLLLDMLAAAPSDVSGRTLKAVLYSGVGTGALDRLCEKAVVAILPIPAILMLVRYLRERREIDLALYVVRSGVEQAPEDVQLRLQLFGLLRSMNNPIDARVEIETAARLAPTDARVQRELGRLECWVDLPAAAERHFRAAIALDPGTITYRLDLGHHLLDQKQFDDVIEFLRKTATQFPEAAAVHALLGHSLRWHGRHEEALTSLTRALELDPDNASAMVDIAKLNEELGDCESGLHFYRRAAEIRGPSFSATRYCYALLGAGRVREAWAANFNRVEHRAFAALPGIRAWGGESLEGKSIMVIGENGVGDQIRDATSFADLIAIAGHVTITCDPRLVPLFQRSFPQAAFLPVLREHRVANFERMLSQLIDERAYRKMQEHNYCVLSPDLLYYFRGANELWGHKRCYLKPDSGLHERWRERVSLLGPGLKIGISWRSGALNYNRECLYTRILDWGPILRLPGVKFVNLQYDECQEEIRAVEKQFGVRIHGWDDLNRKDDFEGVSALLQQLDLVLSPNTTVTEHAGALGVPTLYMVRVPIAYDHWRRKDTTGQDRMYPSVRHIYGDRPWDTASLVANTAAEIRKLGQAHLQSADFSFWSGLARLVGPLRGIARLRRAVSSLALK